MDDALLSESFEARKDIPNDLFDLPWVADLILNLLKIIRFSAFLPVAHL